MRERTTFFVLVCRIISFYSNKFFFSLFFSPTLRTCSYTHSVCRIDLLCVQLNFRALGVRIFVCSLFIFQFHIVMVFTTTWTDISITCYFDISRTVKLYWYLMTFNFSENPPNGTHTDTEKWQKGKKASVYTAFLASHKEKHEVIAIKRYFS